MIIQHLSGSLLLTIFWTVTASRHCNTGFYWDSKLLQCRLCSACPPNHIIREPCISNGDTVCGPFEEFSSFNQIENKDEVFTSYENELLGDGSNPKSGHNKVIAGRVDLPRKGGSRWRDGSGSVQNEPIVEKDDGEYWKNLAFALIGVVCILIFVATVVVLIACRKLHRTAIVKRPDEEDDDDSGYVVIRAIRPPPRFVRLPPPQLSNSAQPSASTALLAPGQKSELARAEQRAVFPRLAQRQQLKMKSTYRPKRRLLNYDADDVFESEDSAGSRTSRLGPLHPIPERSVSAESVSDVDSAYAQVPVEYDSVSVQAPVEYDSVSAQEPEDSVGSTSEVPDENVDSASSQVSVSVKVPGGNESSHPAV